MKPKIIITPSLGEAESYKVKIAYCKRVVCAGGTPLIVPHRDKDVINEFINIAHGIILTGGHDPDPLLFGEEPLPEMRNIEPVRDEFEMKLIDKAIKNDLPLLGICKGFQVLNLALGGTIVQDINREVNNNIKHMQDAPENYPTHTLNVKDKNVANELFAESKNLKVNSFHHQGVKNLAAPLESQAESADGLVEMASDREGNLLGVQWHPEELENFSVGKNIFEYFIDQSLKNS